MYEITLICTHHSELGNCNSSELYKAIYWTKPDVIFEELSPFHHDIAYRVNSPRTLETQAIREYLKNRKVLQIPVDTHPFPKGFFKDLDKLKDAIESSDMIESQILINIITEQRAIVGRDGLRFLNSDENDRYILEIDSLTEKALKVINDEDLLRIFKLETENRRNREYRIIQNIYRYSLDNPFYKAIMLIGSGHRKSILKLIDEFQEEAQLKLNWKIY